MQVDICDKAGFLLRITVKLVKVLHIVIPILLIIFIMYDFFKVFNSQLDEKSKKDAISKVAKRLVYAVIVFLVPTIITLTFKTINNLITTDDDNIETKSTSWLNCWVSLYEGGTTTNYKGSSYTIKATATPRPKPTDTPVPTLEPTPPPCSYYTISSSCANANCYWYNNTCNKESNIGCCYRDDVGLWVFENNSDWCEGQGLKKNVTKDNCLKNNNASETPSPVDYFDDDDTKSDVSLNCYIGPIQAFNTAEGNEVYIRGRTEMTCQASEPGTLKIKSDNGDVVYFDNGKTSIDNVRIEKKWDEYNIVILPKNIGTTKIIVTYEPNDTNTFNRNSVMMYVKVPSADE